MKVIYGECLNTLEHECDELCQVLLASLSRNLQPHKVSFSKSLEVFQQVEYETWRNAHTPLANLRAQ